MVEKILYQIYFGHFSCLSAVTPGLVLGQDEEDHPEEDVSDVAEEMVEVREAAGGDTTLEVEVAEILVAGVPRLLLVTQHLHTTLQHCTTVRRVTSCRAGMA